MKNISTMLATFLLVTNASRINLSASSDIQTLSEQDMKLGLHELALNTGLNQLDIADRNMLKTYLQVELNEFFMDKIDNTEYFAGLDEMEKSQFIGNFFMWVKNQFVKQKVEPKQVEVRKPEAKKVEAKKPETKKPEVKKSEANKSEVKKSDVNKTESKKPELKQPEVKKPEAQKVESTVQKSEPKKPEQKSDKKPEAKKPPKITIQAEKPTQSQAQVKQNNTPVAKPVEKKTITLKKTDNATFAAVKKPEVPKSLVEIQNSTASYVGKLVEDHKKNATKPQKMPQQNKNETKSDKKNVTVVQNSTNATNATLIQKKSNTTKVEAKNISKNITLATKKNDTQNITVQNSPQKNTSDVKVNATFAAKKVTENVPPAKQDVQIDIEEQSQESMPEEVFESPIAKSEETSDEQLTQVDQSQSQEEMAEEGMKLLEERFGSSAVQAEQPQEQSQEQAAQQSSYLSSMFG